MLRQYSWKPTLEPQALGALGAEALKEMGQAAEEL